MRAQAKYQRLSDGKPTTATDPERGVWYSAHCMFWTDEWDLLQLLPPHRIPACPHCGSVGFQITAGEWEVPDEYEAEHPGYRARLAAQKNAACRRRG